MKTNNPPKYCGMYEKVKDRIYTIEKSALLGFIKWDEIVHCDKLSSEIILVAKCDHDPDKVIINDKEYKLI